MDKGTAKTGLARIVAAFFYSAHGLRYAIRNEAAFRQEAVIFVVLLIPLLFLPIPILFKFLLLLANTIVLVVELINSAVEAIVDLASPDYHLLAKHAKDLGSAAVFVSLVVTFVLWCAAVFPLLAKYL